MGPEVTGERSVVKRKGVLPNDNKEDHKITGEVKKEKADSGGEGEKRAGFFRGRRGGFV